jgi:hypothetical protein
MAEYFFDTSAAVKHYRSELGTAKVDALLADPSSRHYLSTLGVIELHSVFARLVRNGQITASEFLRLRGRLLTDIASGPLDAFVCADGTLGSIAAAEGLIGVNPEVP